jgi:hypothetical protein
VPETRVLVADDEKNTKPEAIQRRASRPGGASAGSKFGIAIDSVRGTKALDPTYKPPYANLKRLTSREMSGAS